MSLTPGNDIDQTKPTHTFSLFFLVLFVCLIVVVVVLMEVKMNLAQGSCILLTGYNIKYIEILVYLYLKLTCLHSGFFFGFY